MTRSEIARVSREAKELIQDLLELDPAYRIDGAGCLFIISSPYFPELNQRLAFESHTESGSLIVLLLIHNRSRVRAEAPLDTKGGH